jgi:hypothetical protein
LGDHAERQDGVPTAQGGSVTIEDVDGPAIVDLMQRRNMDVATLAATIGMKTQFLQDFIDGKEPRMLVEHKDALLTLGLVYGAGDRSMPITLPDELPLVQEEPAVLTGTVYPGERKFSNSEIQTFKRCRRKWWLGWHRGLKLRDEDQTGVRQIGNRLHRALEVAYTPGGPIHDALLPAHEGIVAHDRMLVVASNADQFTLDQFTADVDLERIMLEGYIQWLEETGADSNLEVIAAEQYVEAWINEVHAAIIGKMDVIVRVRTTGAWRFIDHKSVGTLTQPLEQLPRNEQMRHYTLLQWMTRPPGQRVDGALFNMLRRVKRTGRAKPPFYAREEVFYNRHVIENFYDRLVNEIATIQDVEAQLMHDPNLNDPLPLVYPTPLGQCSWDCDFVKICHMFDDGSRVEDAIAAQYEVGDPLSYYDRDKEGVNEE